MILIHATTRTLPFFRPVPLTGLPLLYQREHLFPYASYGDTETTPVPRAFRMVVLETDFLRVEVAPELGGRVYSLFDKRIGKEILFSNPVVKPVRILPIWGFISGGIEFNFPIAHSPTSIAEVGCSTGRTGDYGFICVGEREARTGMEWVVELGLANRVGKLRRRRRAAARINSRHRAPARRCPTARVGPWQHDGGGTPGPVAGIPRTAARGTAAGRTEQASAGAMERRPHPMAWLGKFRHRPPPALDHALAA